MALSIPTKPKTHNPKVLVIDDDKPVADLFKAELEKLGYEVGVAANGEEGLVLVKSLKPNLILLDLIMPKVGGRELLEKIRADKTTFSIPIMIISHLESNYEQKKCEELGISCYIVKHKSSVEDIMKRAKIILEKK
ncbi:MAG: response regulator [Patescibacteria group bacterium]